MTFYARQESIARQEISKRTCIKTNGSQNTLSSRNLPKVDIFLNPEKEVDVEELSSQKKKIAKTYFDKSDMRKLYPKLFQILWESTLPCHSGYSLSCNIV